MTLTADGSALVFAEMQARRLSKYWLTGPNAGSVTPLAESLPGMPDNLSTGADGRIWCALVTPANPIADRLAKGSPLDAQSCSGGCRRGCSPSRNRSSGSVAFDPDTGDAVAGLRTEHPGFGQVTGVVEANGKLWLASHRRTRRRATSELSLMRDRRSARPPPG